MGWLWALWFLKTPKGKKSTSQSIKNINLTILVLQLHSALLGAIFKDVPLPLSFFSISEAYLGAYLYIYIFFYNRGISRSSTAWSCDSVTWCSNVSSGLEEEQLCNLTAASPYFFSSNFLANWFRWSCCSSPNIVLFLEICSSLAEAKSQLGSCCSVALLFK